MMLLSMEVITSSCYLVCRASDFPREYDGACLQMRMSYSPAAHLFLFLVQWTDCNLAGALGLLRILIYKVWCFAFFVFVLNWEIWGLFESTYLSLSIDNWTPVRMFDRVYKYSLWHVDKLSKTAYETIAYTWKEFDFCSSFVIKIA